jgi:SAM-dependent methyltransferase
MSLLARFIGFNRQMSRGVEARLPASFTRHLHTLYKWEVAGLVNRRPAQVVLDIGGGKECPFLAFVENASGHLVVAVDCSDDELRLNPYLDSKVVTDAASDGFPFRESSADLIVSRSVVEHLQDNTTFFTNCAKVLRRDGVMVHTFPCRFAPFSLINQLLPNRVTRRLLAYFHPQWEDECGFVAYYDRCYFSAMRGLLERSGFHNARYAFRYYQSIYFDFCFPLYLLGLAYDLTVWALGIRNLACAILVTAERAGNPRTPDEVPGGLAEPKHTQVSPALPIDTPVSRGNVAISRVLPVDAAESG